LVAGSRRRRTGRDPGADAERDGGLRGRAPIVLNEQEAQLQMVPTASGGCSGPAPPAAGAAARQADPGGTRQLTAEGTHPRKALGVWGVALKLTCPRANFSWTDLKSVIFEPDPDSVASTRGIELANNLEFLTYSSTPTSLMVLRERFAKTGFRELQGKLDVRMLDRLERAGQSLHQGWLAVAGLSLVLGSCGWS
jgi:hypothetical protein